MDVFYCHFDGGHKVAIKKINLHNHLYDFLKPFDIYFSPLEVSYNPTDGLPLFFFISLSVKFSLLAFEILKLLSPTLIFLNDSSKL